MVSPRHTVVGTARRHRCARSPSSRLDHRDPVRRTSRARMSSSASTFVGDLTSPVFELADTGVRTTSGRICSTIRRAAPCGAGRCTRVERRRCAGSGDTPTAPPSSPSARHELLGAPLPASRPAVVSDPHIRRAAAATALEARPDSRRPSDWGQSRGRRVPSLVMGAVILTPVARGLRPGCLSSAGQWIGRLTRRSDASSC